MTSSDRILFDPSAAGEALGNQFERGGAEWLAEAIERIAYSDSDPIRFPRQATGDWTKRLRSAQSRIARTGLTPASLLELYCSAAQLAHSGERMPPGPWAADFAELAATAPSPWEEFFAAAASRLAPGENPQSFTPQTFGPFRLLAPLGRGGSGWVYRAERLGHGDRVAVKTLPQESTTTSALARLRSEAHALRRLSHPGIVRLLETGFATFSGFSTPYLAMELVEGVSLTDFIEHSKLAPVDVLRLFSRICDAVAHAHTHGIIHRDLTPHNVLVEADGTPRILDFGIARLLEPEPGETLRTRTGARVGTPHYMSPEQARGERVGKASDIYSLGVLLYRSLTGHHPYRFPAGAIPDDVVETISNCAPSALRDVAPTLDPQLDALLSTTLQKHAEDRYPTVEALKQDIQRYLSGGRVLAQRAAPRRRLTALLRKRTRENRLLLVALVAACASGALAAVKWRDESKAVAELQNSQANLLELAKESLRQNPGNRRLLRQLESADSPSLKPVVLDLLEQLGARQRTAVARKDAVSEYRARTLLAPSLATRRELARAIVKLGDLSNEEGRPIEALPLYEEALTHHEAIAAERPSSAKAQSDLLWSYTRTGFARSRTATPSAGLGLLERAVELGQAALLRFPEEDRFLNGLTDAYLHLLSVRARLNHPWTELAKLAQLALQHATRYYELDSTDAARQVLLYRSHSACGNASLALEDLEQAVEHFEQAANTAATVARNAPACVDLRRDLAGRYLNLGQALFEKEELSRSLDYLRLSLENASSAHEQDPQSWEVAQSLVNALLELVRVERRLEEHQDADQHAASWLALNERFLPRLDPNHEYRERFARVLQDPALGRLRDAERSEHVLNALRSGK